MQLIITPDKNQMESINELNPGSVIFPLKNENRKKKPTKTERNEIIAPNQTKIFNGLSENEMMTLKANETNFEKL